MNGSSATIESIRRIDGFFSRIVSIIPQELYKHHESSQSEISNENSKYFKHRKVALKPDEKKMATKKKLSMKYSGLLHSDENENVENDEVPKTSIDTTDSDELGSYEVESNGKLEDLRLRLQVS